MTHTAHASAGNGAPDLAHLLTVVATTITPYANEKGVALTDEVLMIWVGSLKLHNVDEHRFRQAFQLWQMTRRFWPAPVEIMELASGESGENRKHVAAIELERAIQVHGLYRETVFDDPVLQKTVEQLGGWREVAENFTSSGAYFVRFLRAYEANQKVVPVAGHGNLLSFTPRTAITRQPQFNLELDDDDASGHAAPGVDR